MIDINKLKNDLEVDQTVEDYWEMFASSFKQNKLLEKMRDENVVYFDTVKAAFVFGMERGTHFAFKRSATVNIEIGQSAGRAIAVIQEKYGNDSSLD